MSKSVSRHLVIYIASPYGFSEAGRFFYENKILPFLSTKGTILDPWANVDPNLGLPSGEALHAFNFELGNKNASMIKRSDVVFACLDGSELDSGTAAEVGFAAGLGKRIIGYRSDFRLCGDNAAATVNLQVQYFIEASGGKIYLDLVSAGAALNTLSPGQSPTL